MQLRITDYHGVSRWRWELQDDAGNFLADHEVNLDADAQEYQGYADPPECLRTYRAAHDGGRTGDEELLRRLADWIGDHVFGPLRAKFRDNITQPATIIRVLVPPEAQDLLFCPFELAPLETGDRPRFAPSLSVATPILFGPRVTALAIVPPRRAPDFHLQPTGMLNFPQAYGDQPRQCGRRDPGRAPRPRADVGALRRAAGAGTSRGVASQGRHVIRGGYNHDVELRS